MNIPISNIKGGYRLVCKTVLLIFTGIIFSGCARKMNFGISDITPAAEGYVKLSTDRNDNTTIKVNVDNLAPVERLGSDGMVYVVWMKTKRHGTRNIGQLQGKSALLSKAWSAELKTITAFEPLSFFITAERNGDVQVPGRDLVLQTI